MSFRVLRYAVKEAVRSLIKYQLMSIAAVITVSLCLFMVSISFSLAANLDYLLQTMESYMSVTVFIQQNRTQEDVQELWRVIQEIPHVTKINYVSAQDALEQFKTDLGESSSIIDGLEEDNPLPRSFVLEIDTLSNQDYVISQLNDLKSSGVETVRFGGPAVNAVMTVNNVIRVIALFIIGGLGIIAMVIIFNTIRITVNARKTEINIMKYIGATDSFIRWPFLMEGMLIGILGGALPCFFCYLIYNPMMNMIRNNIPVVTLEFHSISYILSVLIPLLITLGVILGTTASGMSVRRHLQV